MRPLKNCTQTFENLLNSVHLRETKDGPFKSLGVDTVAQLNVIPVKGFKKLNTHFEEFSICEKQSLFFKIKILHINFEIDAIEATKEVFLAGNMLFFTDICCFNYPYGNSGRNISELMYLYLYLNIKNNNKFGNVVSNITRNRTPLMKRWFMFKYFNSFIIIVNQTMENLDCDEFLSMFELQTLIKKTLRQCTLIIFKSKMSFSITVIVENPVSHKLSSDVQNVGTNLITYYLSNMCTIHKLINPPTLPVKNN
ncbi:hypothetical protein AGLY_010187, partial [Aphis glycines]